LKKRFVARKKRGFGDVRTKKERSYRFWRDCLLRVSGDAPAPSLTLGIERMKHPSNIWTGGKRRTGGERRKTLKSQKPELQIVEYLEGAARTKEKEPPG